MRIIIFGGASFIGTNLVLELARNPSNQITLVDKSKEYFENIIRKNLNIEIVEANFDENTNYEELLNNQDIVYHLVSTNIPTTSNRHISIELMANVIPTAKLLEACISKRIKKVVFLSSGGTVYGKEGICPLKEDDLTNPICSYGVQKLTIEKLLYLYWHLYGLDYRVIRLANPYGPYQRPNGSLGVITTFTFKALKHEEIIVYGDGSVIRDFIFIDDAIKCILNIVNGDDEYKIFNVGSGVGTSVRQVIDIIKSTLNVELNIKYKSARDVDVPVNYLDISRYENIYGKINSLSLVEGVKKTSNFLKKKYNI